MHGFMSYRRFGKVWSLRSDQAVNRASARAGSLRSDQASARAWSLRSDRAVDVLGRYITTELGLNSVAT
ncbi:hypothetical protein F2Q69_00059385 [Brassica cretica]|uniref:Uncharacterized protein n=1 Tax=Brassica cretica TaxID=69181 RepID=A0A8S9RAJ1_BRACR|nr:hypothetical protein F2Q69_00059385 [Brassica cretica]